MSATLASQDGACPFPPDLKFLGFLLTDGFRIAVAEESVERFKQKVRELWRGCQSKTSEQLRDAWVRYPRGRWGCYPLAEERTAVFRLEKWIRRHIRKCFWLRWLSAEGREWYLRALGVPGSMRRLARSIKGSWGLVRGRILETALRNATLRRCGFLMPSDLATWSRAATAGCGSACPVVWEGAPAQSGVLDPV